MWEFYIPFLPSTKHHQPVTFASLQQDMEWDEECVRVHDKRPLKKTECVWGDNIR